MQVFKRLKRGQNLIEFTFIFPILIISTLVILEVALYWQDVNSIYNLNSEINANLALQEGKGQHLGDKCMAAQEALKLLKKRQKMITSTDLDFTESTLDGKEPFAVYKYESTTKLSGKPLVTLWVDCRNPFEDGYTTQLEFYHKTLIISASIPTLKGEPIVVIPKDIYIATPKENTIKHY